jgi:general secretion pathway protein J
LALQAGLAQWGADLDAIVPQPNNPSLDWDGRSLRILRRGMTNPGEGLTVVAWSRRVIDGGGQWLRWQSAPLTTRGELNLAWQEASQWAQNAGAQERKREVRLAPIDQWQIYYYRADAWSNPMSSEGASAAAPLAGAAVIPEGIRLVLTLTAGQAITGSVTRDWLRPSVGGGK